MSATTGTTQEETVKALELINDLRQFSGGDDFYKHWLRLVFTAGVKYLADKAGAYWLIDVVASHQPSVQRKIHKAGDRDFQVWELVVNPDKSCKVTCHNGKGDDDKEIYKVQRIPYTDFPLTDIKLFCADGVLMLTSEY